MNPPMKNITQNTAPNCRQQNRHQQGFTLVEIMVAMTISLLLLAGVMQIFLGSKVTYQLQNSIGRLQENVRFSMDIMTQNIGMAGYTTDDMPLPSVFNAAGTAENVTANATLGFSVGASTASDTISINYKAATDCLGNATGGIATDTYFIGGTTGNSLMCTGNGAGGATDVLADGVENMQILYGIDTEYDTYDSNKVFRPIGDGMANIFVTADNVTNWSAVKSVRIALLVSTVQSAGSSVDNNTYTLLNTPPLGPFGDTLMRRVFTRTIPMRNSDVNP